MKINHVRQCQVCGDWSQDETGDYKFICVHTVEEYRDVLDKLYWELQGRDFEEMERRYK